MLWSFDFLMFFFKQKTADEKRISDWSSDVCSADLHLRAMQLHAVVVEADDVEGRGRQEAVAPRLRAKGHLAPLAHGEAALQGDAVEHRGDAVPIGRASWWERVCQYV